MYKKILTTLIIAFLLISTTNAQIDNIQTYRTVDTDGYSQIVLSRNSVVQTITTEKYPHSNPVTNGASVAWSTQVGSLWQLFYYNIYSGHTIQLTREGNNVNPQFFENYVVWEGQRNGVWQILLFDGVRIKQLSSGIYPSQDVTIDNNLVAFSQKTSTGEWKIIIYDILSEKTLTPKLSGISGRNPRVEGNKILWQHSKGSPEKNIYYTYDVEQDDTFFEGDRTERKSVRMELIKSLSGLPSKRKAQIERTVIKRPVEPNHTESEDVSIEDMREELELPITSSETGDTEYVVSPEDLIKNVKESTESNSDVNESTQSAQ